MTESERFDCLHCYQPGRFCSNLLLCAYADPSWVVNGETIAEWRERMGTKEEDLEK